MTQFLSVSLFPLLVAIAGIGDAFTYRIPNWLTALTAVLFFPMAYLTGMPGETILWHMGLGTGLLALGFGLFAAGAFGGGDAKLLAAAGLWLGPSAVMAFLVYTALAGGVLALCVAILSVFRVETEIRGIERLKKLSSIKPNLPYGLAIAAGGILALPQSWWMLATA